MNERIKKLRKALDLTQQEFADRIGVKRNTVATYEIGRNEPIDAVIALICREFNVSEVWLRTGEGDMLIRLPEDAEFDLMMTQIQESDDSLIKAILRAYWNLPDEKKAAIRDLVDGIISNLEKEKTGD